MPKRKFPFVRGGAPGVIDYNSQAASSTSRRSDAPVVGQYSRGNKSQALSLAACPAAREKCEQEAFEGAYTENASRSRASNLLLWHSICEEADFKCPLDITPKLLYTVSGILKNSGYRSALTICGIAKLAAIEKGLVWSQGLDRAMDRCRLYLKRGAGPPCGAASFPMERAPELPADKVWIPCGPLFPARAITVGLWWVCREIELGNITLEDVTFPKEKEASVLLPASKSDTAAMGTERTLRCICDAHDNFNNLSSCCPVCCIRAQHEDMVCYAGKLKKATPGFPLFPTPSGEFVEKKNMVNTISHAASLLGLRHTSRTGAPSWGGHSLRSGGIKFLGANGVELWRIQALARHSSSATLRYLGSSHQNARPDISRDASFTATLGDMKRDLKSMSQEVADLRLRATQGSASFAIASKLEDITGNTDTEPIDFEFVSATRSNALIHTVDRRSNGWSLCDWPFACGKSYKKFYSITEVPENAKHCSQCTKLNAFPNIEDPSDSEETGTP